MGHAINMSWNEPLATRRGMVRELVQTVSAYPLVFVVISHPSAIPCLQRMILDQADASALVDGSQMTLADGSVRFGSEEEAHVYRGTVPVFWDPAIFRRAA